MNAAHPPQSSKGVERTALASLRLREAFWVGFRGRAVLVVGMDRQSLCTLDWVLAASAWSQRAVMLEGFLEHRPARLAFVHQVRELPGWSDAFAWSCFSKGETHPCSSVCAKHIPVGLWVGLELSTFWISTLLPTHLFPSTLNILRAGCCFTRGNRTGYSPRRSYFRKGSANL